MYNTNKKESEGAYDYLTISAKNCTIISSVFDNQITANEIVAIFKGVF